MCYHLRLTVSCSQEMYAKELSLVQILMKISVEVDLYAGNSHSIADVA